MAEVVVAITRLVAAVVGSHRVSLVDPGLDPTKESPVAAVLPILDDLAGGAGQDARAELFEAVFSIF